MIYTTETYWKIINDNYNDYLNQVSTKLVIKNNNKLEYTNVLHDILIYCHDSIVLKNKDIKELHHYIGKAIDTNCKSFKAPTLNKYKKERYHNNITVNELEDKYNMTELSYEIDDDNIDDDELMLNIKKNKFFKILEKIFNDNEYAEKILGAYYDYRRWVFYERYIEKQTLKSLALKYDVSSQSINNHSSQVKNILFNIYNKEC